MCTQHRCNIQLFTVVSLNFFIGRCDNYENSRHTFLVVDAAAMF